METTHIQEVMGSNPGAVHWKDIFHIDLLSKLYCLLKKDRKYTKERPGMAHFLKKKDLQLEVTVKMIGKSGLFD